MSSYQNKLVTVVRAARQGDPGFDASKGEQSIIKLADGTEKTVLKSEVTG